MANVNDNWINLVFCIDSSGSMYPSTEDVIGGFKRIIDEHKKQDGKTTVSLFTFNDDVKQVYLGCDVNDVPELKYDAYGLTRLNDGVCTAIDRVGQWLYEKDCKGEEMPRTTIFVLMTDGMENSSKEFTLQQAQDKIKTQTDVYSWSFIYEGCDITTSKTADELGFKYKSFGSRGKFSKNFELINCATSSYRKAYSVKADVSEALNAMDNCINDTSFLNTAEYEKELGCKIKND